MYIIRSNRARILKNKKQIFLTALISVMFSVNICINYLEPTYSQAQDTNTPFATIAFQSKASIIDNMSSQKVRVGDIEIAYTTR
jgi:hypothetical protein